MAVQRYHRNRRAVNQPGDPLPRLIWPIALTVNDATGVTIFTFSGPILCSALVLLQTSGSAGPTDNVLFPAVAVPSVTWTGQDQSGNPVDIDSVDITDWEPAIRGSSGEWISWGQFQPEHV